MSLSLLPRPSAPRRLPSAAGNLTNGQAQPRREAVRPRCSPRHPDELTLLFSIRAIILSTPFLVASSILMYKRLVLGEDQRKFPRQPLPRPSDTAAPDEKAV